MKARIVSRPRKYNTSSLGIRGGPHIIKSALFLRFTTDRVPPDQIVVETQAVFDILGLGKSQPPR